MGCCYGGSVGLPGECLPVELLIGTGSEQLLGGQDGVREVRPVGFVRCVHVLAAEGGHRILK